MASQRVNYCLNESEMKRVMEKVRKIEMNPSKYYNKITFQRMYYHFSLSEMRSVMKQIHELEMKPSNDYKIRSNKRTLRLLEKGPRYFDGFAKMIINRNIFNKYYASRIFSRESLNKISTFYTCTHNYFCYSNEKMHVMLLIQFK